jgi:hypothetical protein
MEFCQIEKYPPLPGKEHQAPVTLKPAEMNVEYGINNKGLPQLKVLRLQARLSTEIH